MTTEFNATRSKLLTKASSRNSDNRTKKQGKQQKHELQKEHVPLPPRNFAAIDPSGDFLLDEAVAEEVMMMEEIDDGLSNSTVEALMYALAKDGMGFINQQSTVVNENSYQAPPVDNDMMHLGDPVDHGFR